ncbi:hypothetical protein ABBQ32_011656 [Trebouxia sp. C0010 RCD-2024]
MKAPATAPVRGCSNAPQIKAESLAEPQAKPTSSHLAPLAALHVLGGMAVRRSGDSPILLAPRSCRTPAGIESTSKMAR